MFQRVNLRMHDSHFNTLVLLLLLSLNPRICLLNGVQREDPSDLQETLEAREELENDIIHEETIQDLSDQQYGKLNYLRI